MTETPTPVKTAEQILTEAAALLEQGWIKGKYHAAIDGKVCHCADGALGVVAGREQVLGIAGTGDFAALDADGEIWVEDVKDYFGDGDVVMRYLGDTTDQDKARFAAYMTAYRAACVAAKRRGYRHASIIGYNDDADTTAADVTAALREAVAIVPEVAGEGWRRVPELD